MRIWYEDSQLPKEVENALEFKRESIFEMNDLAAAIEKLSQADRKKLEAAGLEDFITTRKGMGYICL